MSARIEWQGLTEFKQQLRNLPSELAEDGNDIVEDATEVTASALVQSYPLGDTGNLRKGVKTEIQRSPFGTVGIVRSTARHSHLWEFGTQVRRTKAGWFRGRMPAHKPQGLVPIAVRNRRRMYDRLKEMLRRQGFQVSGDV